MDDSLSEFERHKWNNKGQAIDHAPQMALRVALDDIASGASKPRHIIVVMVETIEGADYIQYRQAGDLPQLAVEGALHRATRLVIDAGD